MLRPPVTGGTAPVLLSDLPGFPDNLTRGEQGRLWLGLASSHVLAFSENGDMLHDLQDDAGRLPSATGVTEFEGSLYLHNLDQNEFAVLGELPF